MASTSFGYFFSMMRISHIRLAGFFWNSRGCAAAEAVIPAVHPAAAAAAMAAAPVLPAADPRTPVAVVAAVPTPAAAVAADADNTMI